MMAKIKANQIMEQRRKMKQDKTIKNDTKKYRQII